MVNKQSEMQYFGAISKMTEWSVCFQGKPLNITVIQVHAPTTNAKEDEVEWFHEDLQDLPELTTKKEVLFIIGDWSAKVGSQEIPGETGRFGLGVQYEARQRLTEFFQEDTLVIANTLFQQHKRQHYTWTSQMVSTETRLIIFCSWRWRNSTQSAKTKTRSWLWLGSWTPYCKIQA